MLVDPSQHPDWLRPHSNDWYAHIAQEREAYDYPWHSHINPPTAEDLFTHELSGRIRRDSRILDVGCGHGEYARRWADEAAEVVGVDVQARFVEIANHRAPGNLRLVHTNANQHIPFPADYFDLAYTKKGPTSWYRTEARRIVKSGGSVIGLHPGETNFELAELFPGLYTPPETGTPLMDRLREYLMDGGLQGIEVRRLKEIEYLRGPEDVLLRCCFGQKQTVRDYVWAACFETVAAIFARHATPKGLAVTRHSYIVIARVEK